MSQIGRPDFLGASSGFGSPLIDVRAVPNGGGVWSSGHLYVGQAQYLSVRFAPNSGTSSYSFAVTSYDIDNVLTIGSFRLHSRNNKVITQMIPVTGPFVQVFVTPSGGSALDTYDLAVYPIYSTAGTKIPLYSTGDIFLAANANVGVGTTLVVEPNYCTAASGVFSFTWGGTAFAVWLEARNHQNVLEGYVLYRDNGSGVKEFTTPVNIPGYYTNLHILNGDGAAVSCHYSLVLSS